MASAERMALEKMLASFAYKGKGGNHMRDENWDGLTPPDTPSPPPHHKVPRVSMKKKKKKKIVACYFSDDDYDAGKHESVVIGAEIDEANWEREGTGEGAIEEAATIEQGLQIPQQKIPRVSIKKKKKEEPSSPSPFIRVTVGEQTLVVSKFFPLPPGASNPVVLDRKFMDKAYRNRMACFKKERRTRQEQDQKEGKKKDAHKRREGRIQQRSQLSAAEMKSDAYKRVTDDNTWEAPPSCYKLLQERHSFDPWRVLIICMLLNITTGAQVRKVLPGLFLLCPDAETAATEVSEEEIEKVIQTLGLQKKRAKMIKHFSCEYLKSDWTHVTQLPGVGKYAADAYAIFCVGKPEAVVPEDHKLVEYWKFVCEKKAAVQDTLQCSPTDEISCCLVENSPTHTSRLLTPCSVTRMVSSGNPCTLDADILAPM